MQPGETLPPGGQVPPQQDDDWQDNTPKTSDYPNDDSWQYADEDDPNGQHDQPVAESVAWTASEFVHHEKSPTWYAALGAGTFVVAALLYFLTRDFITSGAIILVAVAFGLVAGRRPRTLEYAVDEAGIIISGKHYTFEMFKSFSVIDEDQSSSVINLLPTKRFMPMVNMYYPFEREDEIISVLSQYLPYEHRERDAVDNIMRRLRF